MLKHTPLYETHRQLGARLVDFGGWEMPVQYTSIVDEHLAVRNACGIFDISHMGEVLVSGASAEAFLNHVLTNDLRKLSPGLGQYTLLCNERGGAIDDLYAYRLGPEEYLLVINASRISPDIAWLQKQWLSFPSHEDLTVRDVSSRFGAVAVQGPRVVEFIDRCFPGRALGGKPVERVTALRKNEIAEFKFSGESVWISRTGYTGEDGFEIVSAAGQIAAIWQELLKRGKSFGLAPAGLGARDTLRTEACYPLYGHELNEEITPIEAGVGFFVALDKGEFIGRSRLAEQKANGVAKKCVAFKMAERSAPPRPHYPVWSSGPDAKSIGVVTSGTQSPSLNAGIGMGFVTPECSKPGASISIEIRGKQFAATVVRKPIYSKGV